MQVILKKDGIEKEVKKGFSWTMLFFGCFVPLFRGDFKWALITLIIAFVTAGLSWFVFPFFYNARYIEEMQEKGWKRAGNNESS